jgi:hypothetical protein
MEHNFLPCTLILLVGKQTGSSIYQRSSGKVRVTAKEYMPFDAKLKK